MFKKNNATRKTKLPIFISIAIAAGIVITGFLNFREYKNHYRNKIEQELNAIASLKKNELINYRKERLADANIFYKNALFASLVLRYFLKRDLLKYVKRIKYQII